MSFQSVEWDISTHKRTAFNNQYFRRRLERSSCFYYLVFWIEEE